MRYPLPDRAEQLLLGSGFLGFIVLAVIYKTADALTAKLGVTP